MKKDFFLELNHKMQKQVPTDLSAKVRSQIFAEIQVKESNPLRLLLPGMLSTLLVILVYGVNFSFSPSEYSNTMKIAMDKEILEQEFIVDNLDFLGEVDDIELTDEEWKILLEDEFGSTDETT